MDPERDAIEAGAEAVVDGQEPDWDGLASRADVREQTVVQQLRLLARIGAVHRSLTGFDAAGELETSPPVSAARPTADEALFEWGHLRVIEQVGAGSFGDVYRAWDLRLDREVALKLLRAGARDERWATASREAQLLARVRDPHVMTIFGVEEIDGRVGIWSEFLRGRTVADLVRSEGPLSAGEVILLGDAMCRALAAVHQSGVLHRDIKAQNVIRAQYGRYVLADFGLGLDLGARAEDDGAAGTPLYAAPELLIGGRPSVRSDLYSLGVLLFFALTGQFPVEGRSAGEIAEHHRAGRRRRLHDLRPDVPHALVEALDRALDPRPGERPSTAAAMRSALLVALGQAEVRLPQRSQRLALGLAGLALVLAAAGYLVGQRASGPTAPLPVIHFELGAPVNASMTEGSRNVAAVSPDGQRIAFVGTEPSGTTRIFLRLLRSPEIVPLAGSTGAATPFWSPDSQQLAFFADGKVKTMRVSGGPAIPLADAKDSRGGAWTPDNTILFAPEPRDGIHQVSADGGPSRPVTTLDRDRGETGHWWPSVIPGTRRFLFWVQSERQDVSGVYMGNLDGGSPVRIAGAAGSGLVADGHLLLVRDDVLTAQRFSADSGRLSGPVIPVVRDVAVTWLAQGGFSVSETGVLVYASTRTKDARQLVWYDLAGQPLGQIDGPGFFRNPELNETGDMAAVQYYTAARSEIRVYDLTRGGWFRITDGEESTENPVWSPDGQRMAFVSQRRGYGDIYVKDIRSTAPPELVWASQQDKMPTDWSPDGQWLAVVEMSASGSYDLHLVEPRAGGRRVPVAATPPHEVNGRFSPDGRRLAYITKQSDTYNVVVSSLPPDGRLRTVSTTGGFDPYWLSSERLVYLDPTGVLMEATVPLDPDARAPAPRRRFGTRVDTPGSSRNHYAVDVRGGRLLLNEPLVDPMSSAFSVITNWRGHTVQPPTER
ncbi:MAG: protein kinase [Acidobacteriota bacterium]